jgi:23S rRNA pseudouridine1911/1915/1917 synthase
MPEKELIVPETYHKQRLDKVLVALAEDFSRSRLQQLIAEGYVLLNDEETKANAKVMTGDVITLDVPENEVMALLPEAMDLDILYEDQALIVINKPKGLVVHPGAGNWEHTLVNGLLAHCTDLSGINGIARPGIVHRIDKDTSGCLVVAKNDLAHQHLSQQLQDHSLKRTYWALVHGVMPHNTGRIEAPIGRDKTDRQKMAVTAANAKAAVTHFTVLERFEKHTLVECRLETGRTHQIRVHFQYIGFPVVGDPKYAPKTTPDTQGQCLHAKAVEFVHPISAQKMRFEAPLPKPFHNALETVRQGNTL